MAAVVSALTAVFASDFVGDLAVVLAALYLVCIFAGILIGGVRVIFGMIKEKEP